MKLLFSFGFSIRNKKYYAIVRAAEKTGCTEYHVRIMNRRLDRWLYGHHVFTASNGQVTCIASDCPDKVPELRTAVQAALTDRLQNPAALVPSIKQCPSTCNQASSY